MRTSAYKGIFPSSRKRNPSRAVSAKKKTARKQSLSACSRYLLCLLWAALLLPAACTKPETKDLPPKKVVLTKATLRISTALPTELPLGPGNAPDDCPRTKSSSQMQPEDLNMIKTLSVFQYDPEGNLAVTDYHDYTEGGRYDGVLSTILNVNLAIYDETTVCLVANLYESEFNSIVSACPLLRDFQEYKATIPYVGLSADNLGLGTTERIYMSGYYEGDIRQGQEISVTLGRLVSNIAIGIAASDAFSGNNAIQYVEIQLMNIPTQTFVFPPEESDYLTTNIPRSEFRIENINSPTEDHSYRFYYVPGFGAFDDATACRLHITAVTASGAQRSTDVYLGNDAPDEADRSYSIYRNCNYTFNLRLVPRAKATFGDSGIPDATSPADGIASPFPTAIPGQECVIGL